MYKGILVVLALVASPAAAQQTQCSWVGNVWTCNQQNPPGIDWSRGRTVNPNDTFAAGAAAGAVARQREDERQAAKAIKSQQKLRTAVGTKIQAGDCKGAEGTALAGGDIELATLVKNYCAAP